MGLGFEKTRSPARISAMVWAASEGGFFMKALQYANMRSLRTTAKLRMNLSLAPSSTLRPPQSVPTNMIVRVTMYQSPMEFALLTG